MKENPHKGRPPIGRMMKPTYVLQMNWWHWSDEVRLRWLKIYKDALLETIHRVEREIFRHETMLAHQRRLTATETYNLWKKHIRLEHNHIYGGSNILGWHKHNHPSCKFTTLSKLEGVR